MNPRNTLRGWATVNEISTRRQVGVLVARSARSCPFRTRAGENGQTSGPTGGLFSRGLRDLDAGARISRGKRFVTGGVLGVAVLLTVAAVPVSAQQSDLAGLTLPAVDPEVAFVAPNPDQPNYAARLQVFLEATVPDTWSGQPVQFLSTYTDADGVDTLGLPTSAPKADPNNPNFLYQRFQSGVLFYNASEGSTQVILF